ncbi:MAG: acyl carrier protein [Deltaproteobacteria bacterium]|nr:acyl carrier protein [Deltaproteobacteria bacterium]
MSAAAPADRTAEILRTVEELLIEVVGDELTLTGPITLATSFNADLELESIEFVALAEKLQQHYAIDFVAWISGKQLDEIIQLTVGELVEYVATCQS